MAMTPRPTPDDDDRTLAMLAEADGVSEPVATVRAFHEAGRC